MCFSPLNNRIEKYNCSQDWQKAQIIPRIKLLSTKQLLSNRKDNHSLWGCMVVESAVLLAEILSAFPGARFIQVMRDPLATALDESSHHSGRVKSPLRTRQCNWSNYGTYSLRAFQSTASENTGGWSSYKEVNTSFVSILNYWRKYSDIQETRLTPT